jgi:hypothetical protein
LFSFTLLEKLLLEKTGLSTVLYSSIRSCGFTLANSSLLRDNSAFHQHDLHGMNEESYLFIAHSFPIPLLMDIRRKTIYTDTPQAPEPENEGCLLRAPAPCMLACLQREPCYLTQNAMLHL